MLVQELVDYIGQSHCLAGDEELDCDASEARVKAHITHLHTRMPFDVANFEEDENKSYAREWLAAAGQQGEAHSDFIQPLTAPPIDSLPFDQLLRFWQHPVRAFFQQRLRVNFRAEEDDIPDDEPFTLEGLSRYQLNQQLLNTLIEEQDVSAMFRRFRAAGELPYGAFGELVWETQRLEMQALAERVMAERQQAQSMEIDLQCGGVNLTGWLQQVQPDGLLRWRPSLLSVSQGMQLWLEHLVYCASGGTGESRLFVRKEGEWRFPALAPAEAQAYLNELVDGYLLGMSQPLLLLPESGGAAESLLRRRKGCHLNGRRDAAESAEQIPADLRREHGGQRGGRRYLVSTPVAFAGAGALRRNHCPDAALSVTAISLPSVHTNLNSIKIAH